MAPTRKSDSKAKVRSAAEERYDKNRMHEFNNTNKAKQKAKRDAKSKAKKLPKQSATPILPMLNEPNNVFVESIPNCG